jgi:hypothetical protein
VRKYLGYRNIYPVPVSRNNGDKKRKVVTLDNLRVPFITEGRFKILSFRSKDPAFKTDPGVIPTEGVREQSGIEVVQTNFLHNDMRDTGPDEAKASIQGMLDKFLDDESPLRPVETKALPEMTDPGPVAPYMPLAPAPEMGKRVGLASSAIVAPQ